MPIPVEFDLGAAVPLLAALLAWLWGKHADKVKKQRTLMNYICMDWNVSDEKVSFPDKSTGGRQVWGVVVDNCSGRILRDFFLEASSDHGEPINVFVPFLRPGQYFVLSKYKAPDKQGTGRDGQDQAVRAKDQAVRAKDQTMKAKDHLGNGMSKSTKEQDYLISMEALHQKGIYFHPVTNFAEKRIAGNFSIKAGCMDENGKHWEYSSKSMSSGKDKDKYLWTEVKKKPDEGRKGTEP